MLFTDRGVHPEKGGAGPRGDRQPGKEDRTASPQPHPPTHLVVAVLFRAVRGAVAVCRTGVPADVVSFQRCVVQRLGAGFAPVSDRFSVAYAVVCAECPGKSSVRGPNDARAVGHLGDRHRLPPGCRRASLGRPARRRPGLAASASSAWPRAR